MHSFFVILQNILSGMERDGGTYAGIYARIQEGFKLDLEPLLEARG